MRTACRINHFRIVCRIMRIACNNMTSRHCHELETFIISFHFFVLHEYTGFMLVKVEIKGNIFHVCKNIKYCFVLTHSYIFIFFLKVYLYSIRVSESGWEFCVITNVYMVFILFNFVLHVHFCSKMGSSSSRRPIVQNYMYVSIGWC